ncbi:AraC family transcriptional regulator [Paracoccus marinaquae]|uniref:AraC family transcriptional regulator n=1 Tax=Paracoccus marinaquae TaxID=2841926 RepID=A0ABS6AMA2_9RHOB|nr:AraC family transcriptional regulator [Paracoccus marinaquae]MBU3031728.1 AraC family transcriptional regulator [Paracoccus marinaquae]
MLDIEKIEDHDCFIPHLTMCAFIDVVARKGGIPNIGLSLAPSLAFNCYGVWSDYVLGAQALGRALDRAARSIGYHSFGDRVALTTNDGTARFEYLSAARGFPGYRHDAAGTIGVMLSLCRHYLGNSWLPSAIELDVPKPVDAHAYEDAFQCPVLFDRPSLALLFDAAFLGAATRISPQINIATIEDVAIARLAPESRASLIGAVKHHVRCQVLTGSISIHRTAHALDISVRSLQRELNAAGLSYRDLVNSIRIHRATELLRDERLRVEEIGTLLGYSSSAHFARAYRRETALSPTEFRAKSALA